MATKAEIEAELKALLQKEQEAQEEHDFYTGLLKAVGITVIAIIVVWFLILGIGSLFKGKTSPVAEDSVVLASNETTEPDPGYPEGIHSWTQWETEAKQADRDRLEELLGITADDTKRWAAEEKLFGRNFTVELPPGTIIVNSGWNGDSWYAVPGYVIKAGDTACLGTDTGEPAIKKSCGNPIKVTDGDFCVRPAGEGLPGTPTNSVYVNPSPPPLPDGVEIGKSEETEDNRGLDPDHTGLPGTGEGGTTPTGSESVEGGGTTVSNPPTTDPVDSSSTGNTYDDGPPEPVNW